MSNTRFILITFLLLAAATFALPGQSSLAEEPACSGGLLALFAVSDEYEAACTEFSVCYEATGDFQQCATIFLLNRLDVCPPEDLVCVTQARLQASLIGLQVGNGYSAQTQPQAYWTGLAEQLLVANSIAEASGRVASDWFKALAVDYGEHPMLSYAYGALAELSGNLEAAEALYADALSQNTSDPLIYLTRGDFFAAHGESTRAALDYFMTGAASTDTRLQQAAGTRLAGLGVSDTFNVSEAQASFSYPLLRSGGGPGGSYAFDLSLDAPTPVALHAYADVLLYFVDSATQLVENDYRVVLPVYPLVLDDFGSYVWTGEDYYDGFWAFISLTPAETEGVYDGSRSDTVFESSSALDFLVSPLDMGDPRPERFRCEGAPTTRLADAVFVRPLTYFEPITLYNQPGGEVAAEIEQVSQLIIGVDEGPECLDGFTWYRITVIVEGVDQATGWIRENYDATEYEYDIMFYD
ncbi:MAG: hypothetical protein IPK52_01195 [Chloroflexi bacterium]|nr:hypothetical protein [Chloroflexota bacterium]